MVGAGGKKGNMIVLIIDILSILFLVVVLLWFLVPMIYGRSSIPTRPMRIRKALQLATLQPGETLYDLGAADGCVLLIAAREFSASAVGIEAGLIQCAWIWLRVAASKRPLIHLSGPGLLLCISPQ